MIEPLNAEPLIDFGDDDETPSTTAAAIPTKGIWPERASDRRRLRSVPRLPRTSGLRTSPYFLGAYAAEETRFNILTNRQKKLAATSPAFSAAHTAHRCKRKQPQARFIAASHLLAKKCTYPTNSGCCTHYCRGSDAHEPNERGRDNDAYRRSSPRSLRARDHRAHAAAASGETTNAPPRAHGRGHGAGLEGDDGRDGRLRADPGVVRVPVSRDVTSRSRGRPSRRASACSWSSSGPSTHKTAA